MNPNRKGCHYTVVKKLSALLRSIAWKQEGDFCLNVFICLEK